jgi:hypothetical protein
MTEDDRVGVGEPSSEPVEAALRGAGVVDHTQDYVLELEGDRLWELAAKLGGVDVAVDGRHGSELSQIGEDGRLDEIACVDDQVRCPQDLDAAVGDAPIPTWQVGIGDQCEPDQLWSRSERARFSSMRSR